MNITFIDTSFFLALSLTDDALHGRALAWQRAITGKLVTSEFVLLEVADHLSLPSLRKFAEAVVFLVEHDVQIGVLPINREDFAKGWELFKTCDDKEWGLTDCISFEIMRERGISDVLTYDRHFEQAGFQALLRGDPPTN